MSRAETQTSGRDICNFLAHALGLSLESSPDVYLLPSAWALYFLDQTIIGCIVIEIPC